MTLSVAALMLCISVAISIRLVDLDEVLPAQNENAIPPEAEEAVVPEPPRRIVSRSTFLCSVTSSVVCRYTVVERKTLVHPLTSALGFSWDFLCAFRELSQSNSVYLSFKYISTSCG